MTVPILVLQDVIDVVLVIGTETEGAKLPFALVVNVFSLLGTLTFT